ncbi:hypothetical protein C5S42_00155 [Candidatus Methanomarinus sp.]|nr:hypothetical protein C5S42_00155 [ANME-2 cluster archaeon]
MDKVSYANKGLYLSVSAKMINDQIDNNFDDSAEHVMENSTQCDLDELAYWDENVTIGVDIGNDDDKELISLGVRNICLMEPKGVPVLPPPHYVVHFNSWMIDVEGRIDDFLIFDADNVCHPNPMFGHEWQVYRRTDYAVEDPANDYIKIGDNTPMEFKFTTGTFIIVPPGPRGIGDKSINFEESSSQFGKILRK